MIQYTNLRDPDRKTRTCTKAQWENLKKLGGYIMVGETSTKSKKLSKSSKSLIEEAEVKESDWTDLKE